MTLRADLLAALPGIVAEALHTVLPGLRDCTGMAGAFDLTDLKREGIAAPAVRVSILSVAPLGAEAGPRRRWVANMAAYIVTKDAMGLPRDAAALAIGQTLLAALPDHNWGEPGVGPAERPELRVIVGRGAREIALHLSAVTWRQPLVFEALDPGTPLPIEVYVGGEPMFEPASPPPDDETDGETADETGDETGEGDDA